MVRVHASKEHVKKNKKKHRRSGSAVHLRPIASSKSSNRPLRGVQSQQELQSNQEPPEEEDYEVDDDME